jgi:hypothetical protein
MFAPLTEESVETTIQDSDTDDEDYFDEEKRQDLLLRFVFDQDITTILIEEIASHMKRLINERDIKAKTVSWEGINMPTTLQFKELKDVLVAQPWIRHFSNSLSRIRNRLEASPIKEVPPPESSNMVLDEAVQVSMSPGSSSVNEIFVTTPDPGRSAAAEPEIGEDQGASAGKLLFLDTGRRGVSSSPNFNGRGEISPKSGIRMNKGFKRGRETDHADHESSNFAKRGKIDED